MISRTHHDIFEKLLQDIARLIAELIGTHTEDPILALEQAKDHYLQLEEKELAQIAPADLLAFLLNKSFSIQQLELTAHFLFAEGKLCLQSEKSDEGIRKLKQARVILEYVEQHSDVYSERRRQALREIEPLV